MHLRVGKHPENAFGRRRSTRWDLAMCETTVKTFLDESGDSDWTQPAEKFPNKGRMSEEAFWSWMSCMLLHASKTELQVIKRSSKLESIDLFQAAMSGGWCMCLRHSWDAWLDTLVASSFTTAVRQCSPLVIWALITKKAPPLHSSSSWSKIQHCDVNNVYSRACAEWWLERGTFCKIYLLVIHWGLGILAKAQY